MGGKHIYGPDHVMNVITAWSTEAELKFLSELGTGKYRRSSAKVSRDKLLEGYAMSMIREDGFARVWWGKIDPKPIKEYLARELEK